MARVKLPLPPSGSPPGSTRPPRRDFAALVRAAERSPIHLPLTHVTDGYALRDIAGEEAIAPAPCPIFGSDLVYLFYGRPAYRAAAEMESNGSDAYWPVCFVLEPNSVAAARIYPFDSGAFHHGRFGQFMYHRMIKEDFELDPDPDSPGRLLRLFWRDERTYFNAREPNHVALDTMAFEAKAYLELLRARGRGPFDERNSAIELQVGSPIDLKGNTLAVILPHEFATETLLGKIEDWGALALPFDVVGRHGPAEIVSEIYSIVRDLLAGQHGGGRGRCW